MGPPAARRASIPAGRKIRPQMIDQSPHLHGGMKPGMDRVMKGGAGKLETAPGVRVLDEPNFPAAWKPEAETQSLALATFRASAWPLAWIHISPAVLPEDGERSGHYRMDGDQLLIDGSGKSRISVADDAVALLDRIEIGDASRPGSPWLTEPAAGCKLARRKWPRRQA